MLESTSYNWFVAPLCQCDACNVRTSYYFQLVLLFACEETRAGVNLRTIKRNLFFFGIYNAYRNTLLPWVRRKIVLSSRQVDGNVNS